MEGPQFALPRTKTPETAPARRSAPGQDRAARQDVRVREEGELEHRQGANQSARKKNDTLPKNV